MDMAEAAKHTPGPWVAFAQAITADSRLGLHVAFAGRGALFGIDGAASIGEDEALANARLIAAAPDLLDALGLLGNEANDAIDAGDLSLIRASTLDTALAAIAKATTQQPQASPGNRKDGEAQS